MVQSKVILEVWCSVFGLHNTVILRPTILKSWAVVNQECLQQGLKWPVHFFFTNKFCPQLHFCLMWLWRQRSARHLDLLLTASQMKNCIWLHSETHSLHKLLGFPSGHLLVCNKNPSVLKCGFFFQCIFKRSRQSWVIVPNLVLYWSRSTGWGIFQYVYAV